MKQALVALLVVCSIGLGVALWYRANGTSKLNSPPENVDHAPGNLAEELPPSRNNLALIAPLHQAVAAGDIYAVRSYLDNGVPLDERGENGMPPLLVAAQNGNAHIAVELLEAGAGKDLRNGLGDNAVHLAAAADELYTLETLNHRGVPFYVRNDKEFTPLHTAAETGSLSSIIYLSQLPLNFEIAPENSKLPISLYIAGAAKQFDALDVYLKMGYMYRIWEMVSFGDLEHLKKLCEADPGQINSVQESTGFTPLLLAVASNQGDITKFLIEKGASMYSKTIDQYNTMSIAIYKKLPDMIRMLIDFEYDINAAILSNNADTPLQYAVRCNNEEALQIFLEKNADINALGGKGLTALHIATLDKRIEMAKLLLAKGANVNFKDSYCPDKECKTFGSTPFQWALSMGQTDLINLYLENGADINTQRKDGQAPLHLAANTGNEEYVTLLIGKEADVNLADANGQTPLHVASTQPKESIIKMLLDAGADIEAKDKNGLRPLHLAASVGNEKTTTLLLERGADIESTDHLEKTPLYAALENAQPAVAHLLLKHNAKTDVISREDRTLLFPAVKSNLISEISLLLEKGLDINKKDHQGQTPLHIAAQVSTQETLKFLLEHGADPNVNDRFNQVPLHFAADRGFTVFIRDLLLAGANVRAETRWGQFPIHRSAFSGRWGAIRYFLLADPSMTINTTDSKGNTPLHMALQSGMPSLIEIMIENGADIQKVNERGFSPLTSVSKLRYATIHPQDNQTLELKKREGYKIMTDFLRAALYDRLRAAVYAGKLEEVDSYLTKEPSLLNVMVNGECPLHLAARIGNLDMVKKLIGFGANSKYKTHTLKPATAAELAIAGGHQEIAEYLGSLDKAA